MLLDPDRTDKHDRIYDEVARMPPNRKRIYKILNILHLISVFGGMFLIGNYVRYYVNGGDSFLFEWIESLRQNGHFPPAP